MDQRMVQQRTTMDSKSEKAKDKHHDCIQFNQYGFFINPYLEPAARKKIDN